jgi:hypothetical protein
MAPGANSYGTAAEVAALTKRFTANGSFTTSTNPTLVEVEKHLDTASAWLNTALAKNGFKIPVTQADVKLVLAGWAVRAASDLVQYANSYGRFFTEKALERGIDPLRILARELAQEIEDAAAGFEALGAERLLGPLDQVDFRDGDDNGNDVPPLFQRNAFGNTVKDWNASRD